MKQIDNSLREEFFRQNFIAIDLVDLVLAQNPLYLCSGGRNIEFSGREYNAQGNFIGFGGLTEDFDVRVGKFTISLSAVGNDYISRFVDTQDNQNTKTDYEGRRVIVRKAFLNYNTGAIIHTPLIIFDGIIFNVSVTETATSCAIAVECASLFSDFERLSGRRTNNQSNWLFQNGYTDDLSFEQSGIVQSSEYKWGRV
jgi:hypothetical protein